MGEKFSVALTQNFLTLSLYNEADSYRCLRVKYESCSSNSSLSRYRGPAHFQRNMTKSGEQNAPRIFIEGCDRCRANYADRFEQKLRLLALSSRAIKSIVGVCLLATITIERYTARRQVKRIKHESLVGCLRRQQ